MKTFPRRPDGTRKPRFENADELIDTFNAYLQELDSDPIKVFDRNFVIDGQIHPSYRERVRAPTHVGWADFIGVTPQGWRHMCKEGELADECKRVDNHINRCLLELGAAEAINPGFTARLAGLAEKTDHVSSDGSMTPKGRTLDDFYKEPDVPAKSSAS